MVPISAVEQAHFQQRSFIQSDATLNSAGLGFYSLTQCGTDRHVFELGHFQIIQLSFLHSAVPRFQALLRLAEHYP
ncbi:hypothetical protein D1872_196180 [compost metagenome]